MNTEDRVKSLDQLFGKRTAEDKFWQDYIDKMIWVIKNDEIPRFEPFLKSQKQ